MPGGLTPGIAAVIKIACAGCGFPAPVMAADLRSGEIICRRATVGLQINQRRVTRLYLHAKGG
jgi:recombinational DNA repair protein (RecF pathway)